MSDFYFVHRVNPNDTVGGGGCLAAGRTASEDCGGRWVNFFRASTEFNESPHSVICEKHLHELVDTIEDQDELVDGDALPLREKVVYDAGAKLAPMGAREHVKLG
jgi:hypothetical protein